MYFCAGHATIIQLKSAELGIGAMRRALKKAGATRVSDDAAEELRRVTEEVMGIVAKNAVEMMSHAERKTIRADDVRLASRQFMKF